jgi:hypothetical protein
MFGNSFDRTQGAIRAETFGTFGEVSDLRHSRDYPVVPIPLR